MNPETISRIIKLIDKTGDKVVMMDPSTERAIVIMDLADYEKLAVAPIAQRNDSTPIPPPASPPADQVNAQPVQAPEPAPVAPADPSPEAIKKIVSESFAETQPKPAKEAVSLDPQKPSIYTKPGQKDPLAVSAFTDLTQSELLDKINRDIAAWKTAQDRKRTDELKAAVSVTPKAETADSLEDEERFYLEPIE